MRTLRQLFVLILVAGALSFVIAVADAGSKPKAGLRERPLGEVLNKQENSLPPSNRTTTSESFEIRSTRRISIPYGFDAMLPILPGGAELLASGHGACTADQQVTLAITVTQPSSSAQATAETQQLCSGQLQNWRVTVAPVGPYLFSEGAAEACGFATTRDAGNITDTYEWCRDVALVVVTPRVYVPMSADW